MNLTLRTILALATFSAVACAPSPVQIKTPPRKGTLHESLSLQVTSGEKSRSILFNTARFAELLAPVAHRKLKEAEFELGGEKAEQHLVVHVLDAGRGTGNVKYFCELEVYAYADWPGKLRATRNKAQTRAGALTKAEPLLHLSLGLEDKKRQRLGDKSVPAQGAEFCASGLAQALVDVRNSTPNGK